MIAPRRKRVAIVQSCYIPWKGYFDLIRAVDEFVLLDDVQFTKRDWRNRNRIQTPTGPRWLTIPVVTKGRFFQAIDETEIAEAWADKHWSALAHAYAKAPHFREMAPVLLGLYDAARDERMLSRVNYIFTTGICRALDIPTRISWSRDYPLAGAKTDRLLSICAALGATHYVSGPSAKAYLELDKFHDLGMSVAFADYSGYPDYPQLSTPIEHGVSIVDLLFCVGREAPRYMKSLGPSP